MISVSVIIPAYNAEKTIADALESVRAQTFLPAEIIVVDDGSTDTTAECIRSRFGDVCLLSTENRGAAHARNAGIQKALSDYVAFLDADDVWLPDHLAHAAQFFGRCPDAAWFSSAFRIQTASGVLKEVSLNVAENEVNYFKNSLSRSFICTPSLVIRRETLLKTGLFCEGWTFGEDLNLWVRLALVNPTIGYNNSPGCLIRKTQGSVTFDKRKYAMKNTIRVLYNTSAVVARMNNKDATMLMVQWAEDAVFSAALYRDIFSIRYLNKRWRRDIGWIAIMVLHFHRILPKVMLKALNRINKRRRFSRYR